MPRPVSNKSRRSPLLPFYVVLGAVAVAGAGVLGWQALAKEPAVAEPLNIRMSPEELNRVQGISMGREDAPVVIWEFADYQCPGCAQFSLFTAPLIKERLVDTGLARFVYYDFPLPGHPHAFQAARAVRCAGDQGKFWEYQNVVYGQQQDWSPVTTPAAATEKFLEYAGSPALGLEEGAFEQCLRSDRFAREVTENREFGASLGVGGTPTVIINGKRLPGVPSIEDVERTVREESGMAAQGAAPADASAPAAAGS